MGLPHSNSEESKMAAEAALEEELLPSIDPRLYNAVRNPQFRGIVLHMEEKIRKFLLNPDLHEIELPNFDFSNLREITGMLARYYGLKPLSTESTRAFSKKTPNCSLPSFTLSSIPPAEPDEELTALSRNSPESKTRRRSLGERDEEYYKARARIFNESVSSSSISPVVSRSISPVQSAIVRDGDQDGTDGRRRIRIPVHNPGANQNSNQTLDKDGTVPRSRIRIPVHYPGANQNSNQTRDQDGTIPRSRIGIPVHNPGAHQNSSQTGYQDVADPRLRIRIPVHNPGAYQNSSQTGDQDVTDPRLRIRIPVHNPGANQTSPRPGRRITRPPPLTIEEPRIPYDASNFLHQPMQYPSMQYGQPALPPYGESLYPYVLEPYGSYPMYQYHPYLATDPLYDPAYANYMPWYMLPSMQSLNHGLYNPAYSGYMHWPPVTDYDELLQYYGASIERPSTPYLDAYEARAFPSTLVPRFLPDNPANSTLMQRSMPQSTQPRSVAAQRPSTSVAFQIQRENNETGRLQRLVTNARQLMQRRGDKNRRWSL